MQSKTKKQLGRIAEEPHSSPDPSTRNLKTNRTTTTRVIIPEINHDFRRSCFPENKKAGQKISNAVAVKGFSDNKITDMIDRQLAAVDQPSLEMERRSAQVLIDLLK